MLLIQFLAMIVHRVGTLTHFLGRAPYKGNEAYNTSWAFNDRYEKKLSNRDPHLNQQYISIDSTSKLNIVCPVGIVAFRYLRVQLQVGSGVCIVEPDGPDSMSCFQIMHISF